MEWDGSLGAGYENYPTELALTGGIRSESPRPALGAAAHIHTALLAQ